MFTATRTSSRLSIFRVAVALSWVVVAAVLIIHALEYRSFFADDGFISLRYAKRFIQGHGLTWSGGERVEGYTNFLWILLVAACGWITRLELVTIARVLGIASALAALLAILVSNFPRRIGQLLPSLAVASTVALYGPFATWSIGGLEQPLLAALVAWALVYSLPIVDRERSDWREVLPASALFAFAALTRPDAILFAGSAAVGLVLARHLRAQALVDALQLLALPLIMWATHVAFRRMYYGDWVPNTFHAKVALSWDRLNQGWLYLSSNPAPGLVLLAPLGVTVVAAFCESQRRRRIILVALPLLVWVAYVMVIGGDIMPRHRHLVPAAVLLGILDAEGLAFLAKQGRCRVGLANATAAALVVSIIWAQTNDPSRARVLAERWEWRGRPVGAFLRRYFADKSPLIAVDAAGATPYYAEIDALDMLGLNDRYLALHPPANFGTGWLGHELGDGKYVLRRKPDFVLFARPPGARIAMWRGGHEMQRNAEFKRLYKLVAFDTGGQDAEKALIWVRIDDSRVGIVHLKDRIVVPGYLLASEPGPVARADEAGRLATVLNGADVARLPPLTLPAGSWRVRIEADGNVTLRASPGGNALSLRDGSEILLDIPVVPSEQRQQVVFDVHMPNGGKAHVRSITLDRVVDRKAMDLN